MLSFLSRSLGPKYFHAKIKLNLAIYLLPVAHFSYRSTNVHDEEGINIPGLISVIIFYILIFVAGIYASWKSKRDSQGRKQTSEDLMLAGRSLGLVVGFFTMTGTF